MKFLRKIIKAMRKSMCYMLAVGWWIIAVLFVKRLKNAGILEVLSGEEFIMSVDNYLLHYIDV